MASSQEYIDFVCSQLKGAGVIRTRRMFGDWCIYVDEKPVMLVCDEQCYVKKHEAILALMQEAQVGFPYDGVKEHYILDIEHRENALAVVKKLAEVLPYPKRLQQKAQ